MVKAHLLNCRLVVVKWLRTNSIVLMPQAGCGESSCVGGLLRCGVSGCPCLLLLLCSPATQTRLCWNTAIYQHSPRFSFHHPSVQFRWNRYHQRCCERSFCKDSLKYSTTRFETDQYSELCFSSNLLRAILTLSPNLKTCNFQLHFDLQRWSWVLINWSWQKADRVRVNSTQLIE